MRSSLLWLGTVLLVGSSVTVACATATDTEADGAGGNVSATGGGTASGGVFGTGGSNLGGASTGGVAATGGAASGGAATGGAATGGGTSTGGTAGGDCTCTQTWTVSTNISPALNPGDCIGYMGTAYKYEPENTTQTLSYADPNCVPGTPDNHGDGCKWHAKLVSQGSCP